LLNLIEMNERKEEAIKRNRREEREGERTIQTEQLTVGGHFRAAAARNEIFQYVIRSQNVEKFNELRTITSYS